MPDPLTLTDVLRILDIFGDSNEQERYKRQLEYGPISEPLLELVNKLGADWVKKHEVLISIATSKGWPCNMFTLTEGRWICGLKDEDCGVCKAAMEVGLRVGTNGYAEER